MFLMEQQVFHFEAIFRWDRGQARCPNEYHDQPKLVVDSGCNCLIWFWHCDFAFPYLEIQK
jgi:hypothetical protein